MNWSTEQEAIFAHFASIPAGNLVIEAFAGTGKTTTVKAAFEHAPEQRILYAVFNKKNQIEAQEKIKDERVDVRTLHSLGFMYIKRVWGKAKPDENVEYDRIMIASMGQSPPLNRELEGMVAKLVGFAKNTTIDTTLDDLAQICEQQDLDFTGTGVDGPAIALKVLELSKSPDPSGRISFDDMVWLPVAMKLVTPRYDLVCIDEAQDMNLPQLTMARLASKGRVVAVGDSRQAIYGFRGAVQNGMRMMRMVLKAATLKLTITYRCPKKVVEKAQEIVPEYQAAAEAPDGEITNCTEAKVLSTVAPGDAILSRLNAPLMPMALDLIRRRIPARIEGRDIGKQLVGMVRSMKARSIPEFFGKVAAWEKKQIDRLSKAKNSEKRIEQTMDIAKTLLAVAEGCNGMKDVEDRIQNLFQDTTSDSKPAVVLSSVHKAKGLEWNRVFMLSDTFRKGKGMEEDNIWYVAVTRTKRELFMVCGKGKQEEKPAAPPPTAEHCIAVGGFACSCGADSCLCQICATVVCGTQTSWVEGKGNVCNRCRPSGDTMPKVSQACLEQRHLDCLKPAEPCDCRCHQPKQADSFNVPSSHVLHQIGNVIKHAGSEYVCTTVNDCNAKFQLLTKRTKKITYREDGEEKTKEIADNAERLVNLCNSCEPSDILRKMSQQEVDEFLSCGKVRQAENKTNKDRTTDSEKSMSKKNKKSEGSAVVQKVNGHPSCAKIIVNLAAEGKTKAMALEEAAKIYPFYKTSERWNGLFNERWARAVDRAKAAKAAPANTVAKAAAKAVSKAPARPVKGSKKPAAKKAPARKQAASATPAPAAPAASAPPRPTPPPAATPAPAEQPTTNAASEPVVAQ